MKKVLDGPLQPGEVMTFGGIDFSVGKKVPVVKISAEFEVFTLDGDQETVHVFDNKEDASQFLLDRREAGGDDEPLVMIAVVRHQHISDS
jgi:hypothetical protein